MEPNPLPIGSSSYVESLVLAHVHNKTLPTKSHQCLNIHEAFASLLP